MDRSETIDNDYEEENLRITELIGEISDLLSKKGQTVVESVIALLRLSAIAGLTGIKFKSKNTQESLLEMFKLEIEWVYEFLETNPEVLDNFKHI